MPSFAQFSAEGQIQASVLSCKKTIGLDRVMLDQAGAQGIDSTFL
jgi:hypothetical protein